MNIREIMDNKITKYILIGVICMLLVAFIILLILLNGKNAEISKLKDNIAEMKEETENRLKNSDEYSAFKNMILAFAKEKYYKAYNYYSYNYITTGDIEDIDGKRYWKISRIDEVKDLFTEEEFEKFTKNKKIVKIEDNYYMPVIPKKENELYIMERSGAMEIRKINNNRIEIAVEEVYYNFEDGLYDESNITSKANMFILVKKDGIWKVDEFTNPNI